MITVVSPSGMSSVKPSSTTFVPERLVRRLSKRDHSSTSAQKASSTRIASQP